MAISKAKKFEGVFKEDWLNTVPNSFCYRLYDVVSGYSGIATVSDFINYDYPFIYLIDCKSHSGNTVSFKDFSQYERMLPYKDIKGLVAGTVIWFYDHDKVLFVPIQTWEQIKNEDKKSFNIKMLGDENYEVIDLPSIKKRVYMTTDYSYLVNYYKDKYGYK